MMLPYTGTYAALGTAITNGFKLAIQETGLGAEWVRAPRLPLEGEERRHILEIIHHGIQTRPKIPPRRKAS